MDFKKVLFSANVRLLSKNERIFLLFFYFFIPYLLVIILYFIINEISLFLLAISGSILSLGITILWVYFEKLEEKYGSYSQYHFGMTYQLVSEYLPLFIPSLIAITLSLGYILNNLTLGFFACLSFIIPSLMFFRTDVFNDSNCCVDNEVVFGYPTGIYFIISIIIGLYGYYNSYLSLNTPSNTILAIFITILSQLTLLYPELVNKHLPIEIRIKKYFLLYISIFIIIFLILIYVLQNNIILNINAITIAKLLFVIVLAMLLRKWYLNKIK